MSQQIDQNYVNQFGANVLHLSQQKGSKLRSTVRNESQKAEVQFYDRIGTVAAVIKAGRHSNTPQLDTPHSRRACSLVDYEWADLIDSQDKMRSLNDPTNDYVMAAMWAMGRSMDDVIIEALGGTAYSGKAGTTAVVLPTTQKYAANNATAVSNLNVRTLRAVARKFDDNDVEDAERYLICAPSQIEAMLGQTEVTSEDYNSVKALVNGSIDTFMGFKFLKLTRLQAQVAALSGSGTTGAVGSGTTLVGARKCYAYNKAGLILAVGEDVVSRISERDDKGYSTQAYAKMSIGGVRMEEVKVVEILCTES
jgi:DNA-binding protein